MRGHIESEWCHGAENYMDFILVVSYLWRKVTAMKLTDNNLVCLVNPSKIVLKHKDREVFSEDITPVTGKGLLSPVNKLFDSKVEIRR